MSGAPVVVVDGTAVDGTHPASPSDWLKTLPQLGAYTTGRTRGGGAKVAQWSLHVARLRSSLATLTVTTFESDGEVAALIEPSVRRVLAVCVERNVAGPPDEGADRGELTVVIAVCASDGGGWTTHAHAAPLPRFDREPTTLLVAAPALRQTNTNAKDVAWPATRAAYDDVKRRTAPEGIGEIILTPDGGATLLEGLTTNLFVVRTRVDMPYHGVADGKSSLELVTAPRDSVLPGLARDAVIRASVAEGLPVREEPVLASDADCWTEAFLTNAVRLVQPVREVRWGSGDGNSSDGAREERFLPDPWGSISNRLYRRIVASLDDDLGPPGSDSGDDPPVVVESK